jgi:hypothetical protein
MSNYNFQKQRVTNQVVAEVIGKVTFGTKPITCPKCQNENAPRTEFCPECGTALMYKCPVCESKTYLGAKFCSGCGDEIALITKRIKEAEKKRGTERELVYNFRSRAINPINPIDHLMSTEDDARYTLGLDESVVKKETNIKFYNGDKKIEDAIGELYLTNKKLIFLGCDTQNKITPYEMVYPLKDISEVSQITEKYLFGSVNLSYVKILWKGQIRRFFISTQANTLTWVEAIKKQK